MHILFLPSWYPSDADDLAGSFFSEQAQAFVMEGHQVGVISVRGIPVYSRQQLRDRISGIRDSVDAGVRTLRLDKVLPFPKLPGGNERVLVNAWRSLLKRYVSEHGRPDVLHAHTMLPAGIVAHALSTEFKIPFVVTEHRISSIQRLRERWIGTQARASARQASALVGVSPGFSEALNEAYAVENAVWRYVPNLLSPQFEDISVRPVPEGPFTFGHVSYLDPHKNVDLLIEAFADRFRDNLAVRVRIAGDSPFRAQLEERARQLGVADRVDFVGAIRRAQIVQEFSKSHVFVMPSRTEAFGVVMWEAMACGVPLISTDTWAGKNAISSDNGLLVAAEDRLGLGDAMEQALEDFSDYEPTKIREGSLSHCGREAFVSQYEAIYNQAMSSWGN